MKKLKKKQILFLGVAALIYFFPFDMNVILNRIGGWYLHWTFWIALVIFVLLIVDGKDLKTKGRNIWKEIKDGFT